MRQSLLRRRHPHMLVQALHSGSILSLFVYAILRALFYEFPMTWGEEALFFLKTVLVSCFLIATATGGATWLYRTLKLMNRRMK
ncbi:MAG TPA: hypothetical protein VHM26_11655 [Chitinophagaceae bacterium]|jgi:hypothetical protein|nr:hypothetical protein [Chitinophagaceae bacterium]